HSCDEQCRRKRNAQEKQKWKVCRHSELHRSYPAYEQDTNNFRNNSVDEKTRPEFRQPQHRYVFVPDEIKNHAADYWQTAQQGGGKSLLCRMRAQARSQLQTFSNDRRKIFHNSDNVGPRFPLQYDAGGKEAQIQQGYPVP